MSKHVFVGDKSKKKEILLNVGYLYPFTWVTL